jgi:hypothetical protein
MVLWFVREGGGISLMFGRRKFVVEMALLTNNPEWVSFGE